MILFGLRGVGSGNACLSAVAILKEMGIQVSVYAESPAYDHFKDRLELIAECNISSLLDSMKPSLVVVTSAAVGGAVPIDLTNMAKKRKLPVVLVEDMWSSHSSFSWDLLPDGVCVVDKFAKNLILRSWPGYSEAHIHITGAPVFDKFVNIQTGSAKNKLREALCLCENWPVIFFTGEIWGMTQAVSMFVDALNNFNVPVYLILRDHPMITLSGAPVEYKRIYTEYRKALKNLRIGTVVDSTKLTSDEVNSGSDLVVGICSTMLVEACYMRKPVLNIWTPEIGQILFQVANNTFAESPITNLGAALKAKSIDEIKSCIRQVLDGNIVMMTMAQEEHFKTDGLSGERVAKVILNYYGSNLTNTV